MQCFFLNAIKKGSKTNKKYSNKKNEDQIWHKNKLKSNVEGWNWKQNSISKSFKKIKKIRTKFDIKIK